MEMKPAPERVSQRLKDQFAPAYLTLTSITQGVGLAFLAPRVEATYAHFDAADWLLTIATFILYLLVWQEYVMQVLAFVWVPTLLDVLVPFAFLACELFLSHFVYHDLRNWLLTFGLIGIVGALAQFVTISQTRAFVEENRDMVRKVRLHGRYRGIFIIISITISLCLWALYDVLHLEQIRLIVASIVLVMVGVFVFGTIPYWNQVLVYANGEHRSHQRRKVS
ncbi:MAG: hypothetical protein H0U76_16875 [Ktedonobacteraceae bacterium]|nr:hypothetical protein [Ktedonobacteraceae bacterium]